MVKENYRQEPIPAAFRFGVSFNPTLALPGPSGGMIFWASLPG